MGDIEASRRNKKPRPLHDSERSRLDEFIDSIGYSARSDHLFLSSELQLKLIPGTLTQSTSTDMYNFPRLC